MLFIYYYRKSGIQISRILHNCSDIHIQNVRICILIFIGFDRSQAVAVAPICTLLSAEESLLRSLRYFVFMSVGSFTAIVVPLSELSSTRISPPCSATISHTSESPNPTPPFSLLLDLSTLKKG